MMYQTDVDRLRLQLSTDSILEEKFALLRLPGENTARAYSTAATESGDIFIIEPFDKGCMKPDTELDQSMHEKLVAGVLHDIESGKLKKVVISRQKTELIHKKISEWLSTFDQVCNSYPAACVLLSGDEKEMWLTATPELLVSGNNGLFRTMALAGTQMPEVTDVENVTWGKKEKLEQQLVRDEIVSGLSAIGATDFKLIGPFTAGAGKIVHLKTEINFRYHGQVSEILKALHPTPAVNGFPKDMAMDFIRRCEPHTRSYYTGYFGFHDEKGNAAFYVNLRCVRIRPGHLTYFAGGGIVEGSVASSEWTETENKMNVLRAVL